MKRLDDTELGLQHYLMCSYLYYCTTKTSPLSDEIFDKLGRYLLDNYEEIEHIHKHLVSLEDLECGTLFRLQEKDYPLIVKNCAMQWWCEVNNETFK